jgi:hypothetical protein
MPEGYCGYVPDGCGGGIENCALSCDDGETCGGGGVPDVCGGGVTCVPKTTADCGSKCGPIGDNCGGIVNCGGCTAPETCGGDGIPSECGAPTCEPRTCDYYGANCGSVEDGCGNTIPSCGTCDSDEVCNANVCTPIVCEPKTAEQVCGNLCGWQSDGCDGLVNCGGCTAPNTCGGGGTPSVCGAPTCVPRTCEDVGANCGPIGDGCGGVVPSCGTCTAPDICGGGGIASVCGSETPDSSTCTGLCQHQQYCAAGTETRLSGKVYAPNGTEALYNALVYVPNGTLPAIATGASCDRCQDENLGSPLVAALTGADGSFVLKNVPVGIDFPLVVKMGKWRRVVTIPAVTACTNTNLSVDQTRLPRHMADATAGNIQYLNIPKIAMSTGSVDEIECVLRKIGVDDREFTLPTGTGRVQLYRSNGAHYGCSSYRSNGTCRTYTNAPLANLFAATTGGKHKIDEYDMAIFDCEGAPNEHNSYDAILRTWANGGGRVFASHYNYTFLHDDSGFSGSATWGGASNGNGNTTTGIIDTSFAKGSSFNEWLGYAGAHHPTYGNGYISIADPRSYVSAVGSSSERFVYTDSAFRFQPGNVQLSQQSAIQEYSFNTPYGANQNNICGRVLYSAFHVAGASGNDSAIFPNHCSTGALTPQEKVLEFMIFDLSACVSTGDPPPPPTCTPKTCEGLGLNCGQVADGCGGLLTCGTCTAPDTCGGGGTPNVCGNSCTYTTCGEQGANCGQVADGCGGVLSCGPCTAPDKCGGGGTANICGVPSCIPRSCQSVGATCGAISDGCGGVVQCGTCSTGVCGGGGTPNVCGAGSCSPLTCNDVGAQCGFIGDGCGGTVNCGTCEAGAECGAGGPNLCGATCVPRTCTAADAECGFIGDGCGGTVNCGTCVAPEICGGDGIPSQCGGSCTATTCSAENAACGVISNGCGSTLNCGACPPGQVCGGGGIPNQCGNGTCTPKTCTQEGANCGIMGDGCGGTLNCGMCTAPQSCGGSGTPNVCGTGNSGCVPLTCAEQNANCGPVADGCGGLLNCGTCSGGDTCGGGGVASQCGSIR